MQKQSIKNTLVYFCFSTAKLVVINLLGFKICCRDENKSFNATYLLDFVSFFGLNLIDFRFCLAFYDDFIVGNGGENKICHDHLAV